MAVQSDTSREQYNGNGSTSTPYVIPFYFLKATHIKVDVDGVILDGGYEVIGEGDENGGSLTTTTAYTSEQVITIYRVVPLTQQFSYSEGGAIGTGTLERNQDTACMQSQQIDEKVERSLKFTISGGAAVPIQPTPNTTVVLDADGNPAVKTAAEMIDHIGVQASVDAAAASANDAAASAAVANNAETAATSALAAIPALLPVLAFNFTASVSGLNFTAT